MQYIIPAALARKYEVLTSALDQEQAPQIHTIDPDKKEKLRHPFDDEEVHLFKSDIVDVLTRSFRTASKISLTLGLTAVIMVILCAFELVFVTEATTDLLTNVAVAALSAWATAFAALAAIAHFEKKTIDNRG